MSVNPDKDVEVIREKDREYGGSWHRRGGPGAFMMLARKWDRIEEIVRMKGSFREVIETDSREEGIKDDLGDLRRYLILALSWHDAVSHPDIVEAQEDMPF